MTPATVNQGDTTFRPAEREANDLLKTAWLRDENGFVVPVDPFRIARQLGIQVFAASLEPDVSGMLVKKPGHDAEVYVNDKDSENRQRFSCAHEIGHYILRASSRSDDSFGYIDRRGEMASSGTNPAEIFANQFAAELLMPQENVRRCAATMSDAALAVLFQVSVGAMRYRLENLGIVR
jgi:Zn-dependent peptidase ImmA (M78 family)